MSVIILALVAVTIGFILIGIMGRAPVPALLDEAADESGAHAPAIEFSSPEVFREAVARLLQAQGLEVKSVKAASEYAFEVVAVSGGGGLAGGAVVVDCVYADYPVSVDRVSELLGNVRGERALKGIFITTGNFTADVHTIVEGPALELVNGAKLAELLVDYGIDLASIEADM